MKYRAFPNSDLEVSEVGFGVWTVGTRWWGIKDADLGVRLLRGAYDRGVNFFDTADVYGGGWGEEILAKALGPRRNDLVLATKFGYDVHTFPGERSGHSELPQDWSPEAVRRSCEGSLRRLKTDRIDFYQLHNPRLDALRDDAVFKVLAALQKEGKIRAWGAALGPDIGWLEEGQAAIRERKAPGLQVIYSIFEQEPTRSLLAEAEQAGCALLVRVPHASGLLDGSYRPQTGFARGDHRNHRKGRWMDEGLKAVAKVRFLAESTGRTLGQAAIQFALLPKAVVTVMPNFTTEAQVDEFTKASEAPPLAGEEIRRLEALWQEELSRSLTQPFSSTQTKPSPRAPKPEAAAVVPA